MRKWELANDEVTRIHRRKFNGKMLSHLIDSYGARKFFTEYSEYVDYTEYAEMVDTYLSEKQGIKKPTVKSIKFEVINGNLYITKIDSDDDVEFKAIDVHHLEMWAINSLMELADKEKTFKKKVKKARELARRD